MKKPVLTIMCGLARSGKSTWIRENKGDAVVVSPDRVRKLIFGHQFHWNAEGFVWAMAKGMVQLLLEQGKDVIVDATHVTKESRGKWLFLQKEFDIKCRIVWIQTSLDECLMVSQLSAPDEQVPAEALEGMANKFEPPTSLYEWGEVQLIKVKPNVLPLSKADLRELDRRMRELDEARANGTLDKMLIPWEDVKKKLKEKYGLPENNTTFED